VTSRRQEGKPLLDVALRLTASTTRDGLEPPVESELRSLPADEVEHGQDGSAFGAAQSSTELLQEERGALGWSKKQDGVDFGHVDAFIEDVDREHDVDVACPQVPQRSVPLRGLRLASDSDGGQAQVAEHSSHVPGVLDADAEPECPHCGRLGHALVHRMEDLHYAGVVAHVNRFEVRREVAAPLPLECRQAHVVGDAEVLERNQRPLVDRLPEPHLRSHPAVEPLKHAFAVGAFRSRRQADQEGRLEVLKQSAVGWRGCVVELVDDHDVEVRRLNFIELAPVQRLH